MVGISGDTPAFAIMGDAFTDRLRAVDAKLP